MGQERISSTFAYPANYVTIRDVKMHYIEEGSGDPILLLHGIPTSSYVWRNIIPYLAPLGRCIAPDMIGFGKSDKPDINYSVTDHIQYLTDFIAALDLTRITLVMHGWGSVIGLAYAMQHEKNCKGLVFYEAFLRSFNGNDVSLPFQEQLLSLQDLENSAGSINSGLAYVDRILPQHLMRELTDEELSNYRQPFQEAGTHKPIQQYLKELPTAHGESKADKIIADYSTKLTKSKLPKLLLYSIPGFITTIATIKWAKDHVPNLEIIDIGEELHLAQETCPQLMGESISAWLQGIES